MRHANYAMNQDYFIVTPAKEAVQELSREPDAAHLVIPAQAAIQGFQSLAPCSRQGQALGPRFRGSDKLVGRQYFFTCSKARVQGLPQARPPWRAGGGGILQGGGSGFPASRE
jgi:hypothetical protein